MISESQIISKNVKVFDIWDSMNLGGGCSVKIISALIRDSFHYWKEKVAAEHRKYSYCWQNSIDYMLNRWDNSLNLSRITDLPCTNTL